MNTIIWYSINIFQANFWQHRGVGSVHEEGGDRGLAQSPKPRPAGQDGGVGTAGTPGDRPQLCL